MKTEARSYPRKLMRCQARVALKGMAPLRAKTIDISLGGVSLLVPEQLPTGQVCDVGFEAPHNGKMVRVIGTARVIYCVLTGTDGYRLGLQYIQLDPANNKALTELML